MSACEQPCCGCLPRPATGIERDQIVQRPVQRVESLIDSPDNEDHLPDDPTY